MNRVDADRNHERRGVGERPAVLGTEDVPIALPADQDLEFGSIADLFAHNRSASSHRLGIRESQRIHTFGQVELGGTALRCPPLHF